MTGLIYDFCSQLLQRTPNYYQQEENVEDSEDVEIKARTERLLEEGDIRVLRETAKNERPGQITGQDEAEVTAAIERLNTPTAGEPQAQTIISVVREVVRPLLGRLFERTYPKDQIPESSDLDPELALNSKLRQYLSQLYSALVKLTECCPGEHYAKLQLSGFIEQCSPGQVHFDLYLSGRRAGHPDWQEAKCMLLENSSASSTQRHENLCDLVSRCIPNALHLSISVPSLSSVTFLETNTPITGTEPMVSLYELLEAKNLRSGKGEKLLPSQRATVFRSLALSMLHMSWEDWLQLTWDSEDIFFKCSGQRLYDIDRPFLSRRLPRQGDDIEDDTDDENWELTQQNTVEHLQFDLRLLHFARLLLEIELGRHVLPDSTYVGSESQKTYKTIERFIRSEQNLMAMESAASEATRIERGTIPPALRAVLEACLHQRGLQAIQNSKTDNGTAARDYIFYQIAKPLDAYSRNFGQPVDEGMDFEPEDRGIGSTEESYVAEVMLYDGEDAPMETDANKKDEKQKFAEQFLNYMGNFNVQHIKPLIRRDPNNLEAHRRRRIKIAIIDSGIDMKNKCIKGILGPEKARKHKRIEDKRSWVGAETNIVDTFGHGTAVAYLLLKVAPAADLYIARVSEGKTIPKENIDFIAKAIRHAAKQWDVDIISLSLGIDSLDSEIDEAIDEVTGPTDGSKPKIIFAAASNNRGGNSTRAYPASRRGVICIHASDGNGGRNDQLNPSVKTHDGNFTTLGIGIPFKWDDKDVLKSGTSFATPIAAGIAANMMEYTRHNIKLSARNMEDFYSPKGMVDLFQLLRQKKGDYGYIQPWFLWDNQSHNSDKVCKVLKDTIVYGYDATQKEKE